MIITTRLNFYWISGWWLNLALVIVDRGALACYWNLSLRRRRFWWGVPASSCGESRCRHHCIPLVNIPMAPMLFQGINNFSWGLSIQLCWLLHHDICETTICAICARILKGCLGLSLGRTCVWGSMLVLFDRRHVELKLRTTEVIVSICRHVVSVEFYAIHHWWEESKVLSFLLPDNRATNSVHWCCVRRNLLGEWRVRHSRGGIPLTILAPEQ